MAQGPGGGGPRALPPPSGDRILYFAAAPQGSSWVWVKRIEVGNEIFQADPSAPARSLGKGEGWVEAVIDDSGGVFVARRGPQGESDLLKLEGSQEKVVLSGRHWLGALTAAGGKLYWLERQAEQIPGLPFLAAAGAQTGLWEWTPGGEPRKLASWSGGGLAGRGDITAVSATQLLVRIRRNSSSEFSLVTVADGSVRRLVTERLTQSGVVSGEWLYWTAPSQEASDFSGIRCVRRCRLAEGDSPNSETMTEWLSPNGELCAVRGAVYYSSTISGLLRVPSSLKEPIRTGISAARVVSVGDRFLSLDASGMPELLAEQAR